MQILVVSRAAPDSVVAYYRRILSADPFHLVNERSSGRTTSFYAEQDGPSIWITVGPNGNEGSHGDHCRRQRLAAEAAAGPAQRPMLVVNQPGGLCHCLGRFGAECIPRRCDQLRQGDPRLGRSGSLKMSQRGDQTPRQRSRNCQRSDALFEQRHAAAVGLVGRVTC